MAIRSFLNFAGAYTKHHWPYVGLGSYFIGSVLLKSYTAIDITLPCLWTSLFGTHCLGCGLTSATVCLAKADIQGAYEHNALIFIILPALVSLLSYDLYSFYKQYSQQIKENIALSIKNSK